MTWRNRNLFRNKAVPVQKFNMGGSVRMRARDNRADMEAGGMVSRGSRMSNQGIKFRGVK